MGLAQGSCPLVFELHEFSNYRILGFLTLFFMKMTAVVKKLTHDIQ